MDDESEKGVKHVVVTTPVRTGKVLGAKTQGNY
jgi:hypothetical protein